MAVVFQQNQAVTAIQNLYGGGIYTSHFDHLDANGNYVIQLFEFVVDDPATGDGHTNTYDWYTVNPSTGAYTGEFTAVAGTLPIILVLDPGHGGTDPGSIGLDIHESAATLMVVNRMKKYLEARYNVQIHMTRTDNQTFPSLHDRAQMAIDLNANAIISHHYNHFDGTATGYQDMIQELDGTYPKAQASIDLQNTVHSKVAPILTKYGLRDRGPIGQDLQVLRDSYNQCPGLMIEGLFLDNKADSEFFYSEDFMNDYVPALCDGIASALTLPSITPATSDFQVYSEGQLVGQYSTLTDAQTFVTNYYNGGGVDEMEIKMVNKLPVAQTKISRTIDFVGKAKGDGDNTRSIWYTGSYTTDVLPSQVASEVNSGYAGAATAGDANYLSYSISNAPVGRQVQMEFDFNLFGTIGDADFIAANVDKITFHVAPKAGTKYFVKIFNPVTQKYELLGTDSTGSGIVKEVVSNAPYIPKYVDSKGVVIFTIFSYNKTLADATLVEIDFDQVYLKVDYRI